MDIQADRRHATTANTALTHISSFNTEQLGLYWPSYCSSLTVVVCLGVNSGPLTVVLLSGFVLHVERAWGPQALSTCNTKPLNSTTVKGPEFTEAYHGSLMLPIAICCHCCPTLPIFNEICRRSAKFILSCLCSGLALVRTVANYGILARSHSFIGRNVMSLCNRFHFSAADFKFGQASHVSNTISPFHVITWTLCLTRIYRVAQRCNRPIHFTPLSN